MFKYTANNPDSALSVLGAALRLYFASFFYTLTLSVIATLTFWTASHLASTYLVISNQLITFLVWFIPAIAGLIFFIPLIKRIYSVGAGLPISTRQAFTGFIKDLCRLTIFIVLCIIASAIIPLLCAAIKLPQNGHLFFALFAICSFIYFYVGLKIYFTPLFIVLENKGLIDALKCSLKIEHNHMWLTFSVLSLYFFIYWAVISFTTGYIVIETINLDLATEIFSVIALPLFLCIQICQFFNLKKLSQ